MATRFRDLLPVLNRLASSSASVDLGEVGHVACLSPNRAQRVFASIIGESPKQYHLRVRLERSAALLLGSDARIVDIAIASGFESHEAYTRAFRRRFGTTPSGYRRANAAWSGPRPVQLAAKTSPCIGLYHRSVNARPATSQTNPQESSQIMEPANPTIERRSLEATPTLFGTRKLDREKIAEGLAEILPAAFGFAMAEGLAMAGPPFVRYIDQSPAFVTVEAGVPLAEPAAEPPADAGVSVGSLPAGTVATAVHKGPYETLGETYMAIDRWMAAEGLSAAGPAWEVYLTDPAEVPDPADWLTEVNWPIA